MKRAELDFFLDNPGYKRIFAGILARYRALGRMGGTVTLTKLSEAEREVLSNHLRRDLAGMESVRFSVQEFEHSLAMTRFADYSLKAILSAYFGMELTTAKAEADLFKAKRERFFRSLCAEYSGTIAAQWLEAVIEQRAPGRRRLWQAYGESEAVLRVQIQTVAKALNCLNGRRARYWRLPVFASQITTDPHAFDLETDLGRMLVNALCAVLGLSGVESREEAVEILYGAGLLVDELSNFVICAGLLGYCQGKPHPVWQGALECRAPLLAPLLDLSRLNKVASPLGQVFVVENPSVFAAILDAFPTDAPPPLICTSGQVNVAGLVLLDLLAKEQTVMYYSGDLDPEGLLIAERLAKRYPALFRYWRFTPQDYAGALSIVQLTPTRLAKLQGITDERLQPLVEQVAAAKRAAYQELLLPGLIADLKACGPS